MSIDLVTHVAAFLLGVALVAGTLYSAVLTFVLPRGADTRLTRLVFTLVRRAFGVRLRWAHSYRQMDAVMALYAPLSLMSLPPVWLLLIFAGYMAMYWAIGAASWRDAFLVSGSSLFTLGFVAANNVVSAVLEFTEAAIGLALVALFISYLPTMYAAFARREREVALLEVRAGSPPSAVVMIERYHRLHGLDRLSEVWPVWEQWFADIEESHTSLAALAFFRSPRRERSWITAAGAVLDAASLVRSTLVINHDPQADLCIRAGYIALRQIADFFRLPYPADPHYPADPINVTRAQFDSACADLEALGVPLKKDREQAWRDFAGWRVNYDAPLLALAELTLAPESPWSGPRPYNGHS